MGLFDFLKVCLFSEVAGVVVVDGKPIAGAKLLRTVKLNDTVHSDETESNAEGKFHFDAMFTNSINKLLPIEPYLPQKIIISYNGREFLAWELDKHNFDEEGELLRKIHISCDLASRDSRREYGARILWGIGELIMPE